MSMGADYNQFIKILKLKFTLDNRRASNISGKKGSNIKNSLIWQFVSMFIMGGISVMVLALIKSPFTLYFVAHSILTISMAMLIISEFSTVLLDTSENTIVQPLPIVGNTLSLARNAHILIYLAFTAFSLMAAPLILVGFKFGIFAVVSFLISIILNVIFTLFLSNILYLGIMNFVKGEKLKNLLMYFQVFMAILFMAGYQIGIQLVDKSDMANWEVHVHWYSFLIPPSYFAGFAEAFTTTQFTFSNTIFVMLAVLLPVITLFVTGKYLTPRFNRKLADLEQGDRVSKTKISKKSTSSIAVFLSYIFSGNKQERSVFILMWRMTGRERQFLQVILPSFAYVLLFIILPFVKDSGNMEKFIESRKYFPMLYLFAIFATTLPSAILIGNSRQIGWLFRCLPVESPAVFFRGFIKSAFSKFILPFYSLIGLGVAALWGFYAFLDVVIIFFAIYFTTLMVYLIQPPIFPFSSERKSSQGIAVMVRFFVVIILALGLGFLHNYMSKVNPFIPLLLVPILMGAIFYLSQVRFSKSITWRAVDLVNQY